VAGYAHAHAAPEFCVQRPECESDGARRQDANAMTVAEEAQAALALAFGLVCLFMPVRWLGVNPYTRKQNPGFDEAKARSRMWIVRLAGIIALALGAAILVIGLT
jgi:hypothetical protein